MSAGKKIDGGGGGCPYNLQKELQLLIFGLLDISVRAELRVISVV